MQSIRDELMRGFQAAAEPGRAASAQAYMKSIMPFVGIAATPMRAVCRQVFAAHPLQDAASWQAAILDLWRNAEYREERYAAIELSGVKRYRPWQTPAVLPMYEEMIVTGAWWDYVDVIAIHRVGEYLLRDYPAPMKRTMGRWSRDENLWKRRTSILSQITFKADTDLDLLYGCIRPSLSSKQFFLRKAIGWALRQYAWTDPREVERYVREHEADLSPLSRREALKNVIR